MARVPRKQRAPAVEGFWRCGDAGDAGARDVGGSSDEIISLLLDGGDIQARGGVATARGLSHPQRAPFATMGLSKSASPRPQRVRPVDAVLLAKKELGESTAAAAAAPPPSKKRVPAHHFSQPPHPLFHDFARAVVQPQLSVREHAARLHEHFTESRAALRDSDRADGKLAQGETPQLQTSRQTSAAVGGEAVGVTAGGAIDFGSGPNVVAGDGGRGAAWLREAECARKEALLCAGVMEQFIRDATVDSRERIAFLETVGRGAAAAAGRLDDLVRWAVRAAEEVDRWRVEVQKGAAELQEENEGLRAMGKNTLSTEATLRAEAVELLQKVDNAEAARARMQEEQAHLLEQLAAAEAEVAKRQGEEVLRREAARDGYNSPMMSFANFVVLPDAPTSASADGSPSSQGAPNQGARSVGRQRTLSMHQSRLGGPTNGSSETPAADALVASMTIRENAGGGSTTVHSLHSNGEGGITFGSSSDVSPGGRRSPSASSRGSVDRLDSQSDVSVRENVALPDACAFPALIPFLVQSKFDTEGERSRRNSTSAVRVDNAQRHIAALQRDFTIEVEKSAALQRAVDAALERLITWVHAVSDSLSSSGLGGAVQQDANALIICREGLEWLAKRPCCEWTAEDEGLEGALDKYEARLRRHLARDRPQDAEVRDLKRSLQKQRKRNDELSEQLLEVRSSVLGARGPSRRVAPAQAPSTGGCAGRGGASDGGASVCASSPDGTARCASPATSAPQKRHGASSVEAPPRSAVVSASASAQSSREGTAGAWASPEPAASTPKVPEALSEAALEENRPAAFESERADSRVALRAGGRPGAVVAESGSQGMGQLASKAVHGSAVVAVELEARRRRLLVSPFVDTIDLTLVPCEGDGHELALGSSSGREDKLLGLKQLQAVIAEVYYLKKTDDQRRDAANQPRRPLHSVLQELLRRQHGVKRVVNQKSWLLVESVAHHAENHACVRMFEDFLDCTRDLDELSFYLYCSSVLAVGVAEEGARVALAPLPLGGPSGIVSLVRAVRAIDLLFGDLPKAQGVARMELEKAVVSTPAYVEPAVGADELYRVLLEGWRMSALLMDGTVPSFSWRQCVLTFMQNDLNHRGWLDEHQVRNAEGCGGNVLGVVSRLTTLASAGGESELRLLECTSLGAFVFREVHRCTRCASIGPLASPEAEASAAESAETFMVSTEQSAGRLEVSQAAFTSVEKALGKYLAWLMHSDEPADLTVYHGVKARIYGYRRSANDAKASMAANELRALLLLLLAHQFDAQLRGGEPHPDHLAWELKCLLRILREGWAHGSSSLTGGGPDFDGADLAAVGA